MGAAQPPKPSRALAQPLAALNEPDALLKAQTVIAVTGLSIATIYRKVASGAFPSPVKLGTRCTRWRAADVQAWLQAQGGAHG